MEYIDWSPFFQTWELRGRYPNRGYPKIFNDERVGEEARKLYADATKMLAEIVEGNLLELRASHGVWCANADDNHEDILIYGSEEERTQAPIATFACLRQQLEKESEDPYMSLADFVAPQSSGLKDYVGMFAVGVFGCDKLVAKYEAENDDYSKIMAQALADRLAEAFAEVLHRDMRKETWGYSANESLDNSDLLKIKYQGIRPAPGYPSQPDHTEKRTMWNLLQADKAIDLQLSDSLAMMPASAVSALVFGHSEAKYFAVGAIEKDQVQSYAARKGDDLKTVERWLAPILNYDDARDARK